MKYMSIIHSVHRVLDMKLFNTTEEAENHITKQMKTYNAKIVSDTEWNNDTDPDADIIEREPFYEETGSNKIKTAIIEVDDYDKFGVYELGTNTGEYLGKEVVQIYLSKPSSLEFCNSKIDLCGYQKTKELKPKESEILNINFNIEDFSNFSEDEDAYLLNKGIYLISVGNSSEHIKTIASIELKEKIKAYLKETRDFEIIDCGTDSTESVDYPIYGKAGAAPAPYTL